MGYTKGVLIEVRQTDVYARWFWRLRDRRARRLWGDLGMATTRTRPWDAADHLESDEDIVAYLEAAFEDGDPALIAAALGDVARARGMTKVASDAGLGRESLYKALSPNGNPELATVLKVMQALGLGLRVAAVKAQ